MAQRRSRYSPLTTAVPSEQVRSNPVVMNRTTGAVQVCLAWSVTLHEDIALDYSLGLERDRLTTWGRLEATRTRELLRRFLPEPPAKVLDVGGAEGTYMLPLART